MQNSYRIPNLHEPKLDWPYNFTVDLQQQCSSKIVEQFRRHNEVDRWKRRHGCPYYIHHIYYEKRSFPYTTGRFQKHGTLTNTHAVKLSFTACPVQFMNVAKEHLPQPFPHLFLLLQLLCQIATQDIMESLKMPLAGSRNMQPHPYMYVPDRYVIVF